MFFYFVSSLPDDCNSSNDDDDIKIIILIIIIIIIKFLFHLFRRVKPRMLCALECTTGFRNDEGRPHWVVTWSSLQIRVAVCCSWSSPDAVKLFQRRVQTTQYHAYISYLQYPLVASVFTAHNTPFCTLPNLFSTI